MLYEEKEDRRKYTIETGVPSLLISSRVIVQIYTDGALLLHESTTRRDIPHTFEKGAEIMEKNRVSGLHGVREFGR